MVRFGECLLPHVLDVQIQSSRIEIELPMPSRAVAYRADQTTNGRTAKISGEIRCPTISEVLFWIELLRRLADDTARLLDLEDEETPVFNAKLFDPAYVLDVSTWHSSDYQVPYSVTLLEVE